jgi:hypothetical protein
MAGLALILRLRISEPRTPANGRDRSRESSSLSRPDRDRLLIVAITLALVLIRPGDPELKITVSKARETQFVYVRASGIFHFLV